MSPVVLFAAFVVLIVFRDGLVVMEVVMVDGVIVTVVLLTLIRDAIVVVAGRFTVFCEVSFCLVLVVDDDEIVAGVSDVFIVTFRIVVFVLDELVVFEVIIVDEVAAAGFRVPFIGDAVVVGVELVKVLSVLSSTVVVNDCVVVVVVEGVIVAFPVPLVETLILVVLDKLSVVDVAVADRVVVSAVLLPLIGDAIVVVVELFIFFCDVSSGAVVVVDVDGIIIVFSDVLIIGFGILIFVVDGLVVFEVIVSDEVGAAVL